MSKIIVNEVYEIDNNLTITNRKTGVVGAVMDFAIDWTNKKVYVVLPYAIHGDGFTYPEMEKRMYNGEISILQLDDMQILHGLGKGDTDWGDVEVYTEEHEKSNSNAKND